MTKAYVINITKEPAGTKNPQLLRIIMDEEYTRLDFGYQTVKIYKRGGWVKISKDTFLRSTSSNRKFRLIQAKNIPISPQKHHFQSKKDWLFFSLYFEPIPFNDSVFDMIEDENGDGSEFNYFGIEINTLNAHRMVKSLSF